MSDTESTVYLEVALKWGVFKDAAGDVYRPSNMPGSAFECKKHAGWVYVNWAPQAPFRKCVPKPWPALITECTKPFRRRQDWALEQVLFVRTRAESAFIAWYLPRDGDWVPTTGDLHAENWVEADSPDGPWTSPNGETDG